MREDVLEGSEVTESLLCPLLPPSSVKDLLSLCAMVWPLQPDSVTNECIYLALPTLKIHLPASK